MQMHFGNISAAATPIEARTGSFQKTCFSIGPPLSSPLRASSPESGRGPARPAGSSAKTRHSSPARGCNSARRPRRRRRRSRPTGRPHYKKRNDPKSRLALPNTFLPDLAHKDVLYNNDMRAACFSLFHPTLLEGVRARAVAVRLAREP